MKKSFGDFMVGFNQFHSLNEYWRNAFQLDIDRIRVA